MFLLYIPNIFLISSVMKVRQSISFDFYSSTFKQLSANIISFRLLYKINSNDNKENINTKEGIIQNPIIIC